MPTDGSLNSSEKSPSIGNVGKHDETILDDRSSALEYEESVAPIAAHHRQSFTIFRNEKSKSQGKVFSHHLVSLQRTIKSIRQFAAMNDEERRSMLRSITDEQYDDIMKVLAIYPHIKMNVTCEGSHRRNRSFSRR